MSEPSDITRQLANQNFANTVASVRNAVLAELRPPQFDPVAKAGLSPAQTLMLEPLACITQTLRDKNDKIVPPSLDFWDLAQIVAVLYKPDGAPRSRQEIYVELDARNWRGKPDETK